MIHICKGCNRSFRGRSDAQYCSNACRQRAYRFRLLCNNFVDLSAWRQLPFLPLDGSVTDNALSVGPPTLEQ